MFSACAQRRVCDEWYHTQCVGMPDLEADLVDQFIYLPCVGSTSFCFYPSLFSTPILHPPFTTKLHVPVSPYPRIHVSPILTIPRLPAENPRLTLQMTYKPTNRAAISASCQKTRTHLRRPISQPGSRYQSITHKMYLQSRSYPILNRNMNNSRTR